MSISLLFWDVDTQHDFMDPAGNLAVPEAARILTNLERLTAFAVEQGIPIVASADAHSRDDAEFDQFPPHCLAGTEGQKKIAQTSPAGAQVACEAELEHQTEELRKGRIAQLVIEKQELDVFSEPIAQDILLRLAPREVVVYGVTTEFCVRRAVVGLRERGFEVTVLSDAIRAVDETNGRQAIKEMKQAGARLTTTDSVLQSKG